MGGYGLHHDRGERGKKGRFGDQSATQTILLSGECPFINEDVCVCVCVCVCAVYTRAHFSFFACVYMYI